MKKMMRILISCMLALSLVGGISAVACGGEGGGIMPLADLWGDEVLGTGTWNSPDFSANPNNGSYIRYYFLNESPGYCTVYLMRTDRPGGDVMVAEMIVEAESDDWNYYYASTAGEGDYYIKVEATEMGGRIEGYAVAAQYFRIPA